MKFHDWPVKTSYQAGRRADPRRALRTVGNLSYGRAGKRHDRIFMQRRAWRERPLLPQTGSNIVALAGWLWLGDLASAQRRTLRSLRVVRRADYTVRRESVACVRIREIRPFIIASGNAYRSRRGSYDVENEVIVPLLEYENLCQPESALCPVYRPHWRQENPVPRRRFVHAFTSRFRGNAHPLARSARTSCHAARWIGGTFGRPVLRDDVLSAWSPPVALPGQACLR